MRKGEGWGEKRIDRRKGIGEKKGWGRKRERKGDFVTSDFHAKSLKHSTLYHILCLSTFFSCLYLVNIMKYLSFSYIVYIYMAYIYIFFF